MWHKEQVQICWRCSEEGREAKSCPRRPQTTCWGKKFSGDTQDPTNGQSVHTERTPGTSGTISTCNVEPSPKAGSASGTTSSRSTYDTPHGTPKKVVPEKESLNPDTDITEDQDDHEPWQLVCNRRSRKTHPQASAAGGMIFSPRIISAASDAFPAESTPCLARQKGRKSIGSSPEVYNPESTSGPVTAKFENPAFRTTILSMDHNILSHLHLVVARGSSSKNYFMIMISFIEVPDSLPKSSVCPSPP